MKNSIKVIGTATVALMLMSGVALAAQPNKSCEESTTAPKGFSTGGFANAEEHYAGNGQSTHSGNDKAVSQYDVACYQLSN